MRLLATTTKRRVVQLAFVVTTVVVLIGAVFFSMKSATPALAQEEGSRLITLHDRGMTTSFMTTEATIEDALKAANVTLDDRDAVEPARAEKLIASDYQVNIYRARPVTVVDGLLKRKVFSPYQSSERIVKDVGISLYPEDITKLTRSDDIIGQGSGLQLEIVRAVPFELTLFGETTTARTQASTVEAMLREKGVSLGENDRTSLPLSTQISEGLQIRVWREGRQTITVDEEVAFEVEKIQDADRDAGYREVKTPGEKGERSVTYEIIIQDGKETQRTEIASVSKKEPKKQVEVIGAKVTGPADIMALIRQYAPQRGLDVNRVLRIAKCESTFNPNARNGIYQGLFQHHAGYWPDRAKRYGVPGASIFDARAQVIVTTGMMADVGYGPWECK